VKFQGDAAGYGRAMVTLGYFLSSEERDPRELVDLAARAEQAGFTTAWISDHYHPWTDAQGQSAFVWSTIGAIANATSDLEIWTAVTCPTIRIHPAVIAQAAATSAVLSGGRFGLGVGSGEALNEHIFGDAWPDAETRLEMLEEAVEVMRKLFTGEQVSHRGPHYRVENARLYTVPDTPPEIYVSAFGPKAVEVAARIAMVPTELLQLNKRVVHRQMDAMGMRAGIRAGTELWRASSSMRSSIRRSDSSISFSRASASRPFCRSWSRLSPRRSRISRSEGDTMGAAAAGGLTGVPGCEASAVAAGGG